MIGFTKLSDTYSKTSTWTNVMYVKATDGENTGYSYMQNDISGEKLGNYYFVSYDSIVNSLS